MQRDTQNRLISSESLDHKKGIFPRCDSNGFFPSFKAREKSKKIVVGNAPDQPDEPSDVNKV